MVDDSVVGFEEKIIFKLRSLYKKYGYLPYKMSKFEEYELYSGNKDFLMSDRIITFNDTNGRLMALKPDVTLSIVKSGEDIKGVKQKVYYDENVYRVSDSTNRFREILQTGLECIGDIDIYDIYEVLTLAVESLAGISGEFYIELSDLDIVYSIVSGICDSGEFIHKAYNCISQKNTHDLKKLCEDFNISDDGCIKITKLISLNGNRSIVLQDLLELCGGNIAEKLSLLSSLLDRSRYSSRIKLDFSVINDMNYYNGIVFRGFINGIYRSVLTGGQYGKMMHKMKRSSEAIGFALYLDRLDGFDNSGEQYDVDLLILYSDKTDPAALINQVEDRINSGLSVSVQKSIVSKLRYKEILNLRK